MTSKKKEITVENKLRALYDLQLVDSRVDEIRSVRGELPLEVQDLEDEIEGLNTRLTSFNQDLANFETEIVNKKEAIKESQVLAKKYAEQQKNVRNNREFDSLSKEIEFQELEIQLAEKRIKEFRVKIEQKTEIINTAQEKIKQRAEHLEHKRAELDAILQETVKEEELLLKKSKEFEGLIEARLLNAYKRIRNKVKNGLAVVSIERGASGGSYFTIPPQRIVEIGSRKKIITDEHSGRILVDTDLASEEKIKIEKLFSN